MTEPDLCMCLRRPLTTTAAILAARTLPRDQLTDPSCRRRRPLRLAFSGVQFGRAVPTVPLRSRESSRTLLVRMAVLSLLAQPHVPGLGRGYRDP